MLFEVLLTSQFWLISDRAAFWDAEKISDETEIELNSIKKSMALIGQEVKGKNVLLLVHGYNNDAKEALSTYNLINTHVSAFVDVQQSHFYDYIIGYLWPGYDDTWEYFEARSHVSKLANKMRSHLEFLSASAAKVDILAHSMGNRLVLEALNYRPLQEKRLVHNYFALAPAVDDESLEENEIYYHSTDNCEKIFIFYSKRDEVLKWSYSLAEWDRSLGYVGAEHPDRLPKNVQLINYTSLIDGHSKYFTVLPIYEFIKDQFLIPKSVINQISVASSNDGK